MSTRNPTTDPAEGPEPPAPAGLRDTLRADPLGLATRRPRDDDEPASNRWALVRLGAVVAVVIGLAYAAGVGETVLLVLALVLCIVAHEAGHFLTAKAARMKVTEFFVGFGPRLWSVRRGETEYGIRALPLGGYCRIIGMHNLEEVDPADEPRAYRQKPLLRRLSVAVAGSAMHFLIALVALFAMFFWTGDAGHYLRVPASSPIAAIDRLANGESPAQAAGFQLGDRIESVDGHHFADFAALRSFIEARPDTRLDVVVLRHGRLVTLHPVTANLEEVAVNGQGFRIPRAPKPTGFLGIEASGVVHSTFTQSISESGGAFVRLSALTLGAVSRLVTLHGIHQYLSMLGSQKAAATSNVRFESPVGVVRLLHAAARDGLATVLFLLAAINISIGLLNLFPMLPFDGGHVVIALYEGLRSRRGRRYHADVAKLLPVFYLVIALVGFVAVSSLFLDLRSVLA
jgi:membrane-associated protease RseP (regulator of RpoE activity)